MGTWDSGLLDNDNSLDGLGDLTSQIRDDLFEATDPGRAAAAAGMLLQLSPFDFSAENPDSADLALAIGALDGKKLPAEAKKVLAEVAAGKGLALAERPAKLPAGVAKLLHASGRS